MYFNNSISINRYYKSHLLKFITLEEAKSLPQWEIIFTNQGTDEILIGKQELFKTDKKGYATSFKKKGLSSPLYIEFVNLSLNGSTDLINKREKNLIFKFVQKYSEPWNFVLSTGGKPINSLFIELPKDTSQYFFVFKEEWKTFMRIMEQLGVGKEGKYRVRNIGFKFSKDNLSYYSHMQNTGLAVYVPDLYAKRNMKHERKRKAYQTSFTLEAKTMLDLCYLEMTTDFFNHKRRKLCEFCRKYFITHSVRIKYCDKCRGDSEKYKKIYKMKHPDKFKRKNRIYVSRSRQKVREDMGINGRESEKLI